MKALLMIGGGFVYSEDTRIRDLTVKTRACRLLYSRTELLLDSLSLWKSPLGTFMFH